MFRRVLSMILAATLVFGVTTPAFAGPPHVPPGLAKRMEKADDLKFKDWGEAAWALQHIARLKAKGILKGYDDGSFKPNASVSQTEAIVMVIRMKSVEAEQEAVALANQHLNIPGLPAVWWATGHINYALQKGWISLSDFQPNAAAKRVWVAKLMVRALLPNWEAEVAANANATLNFKDASKISAADRPYVALTAANKWMVGYPNGQFQPDKPVTRAEMAALLDRGEATMPGLPTQSPFEAKGTITSIDLAARRIGVQVQGSGTTTQYTVSVDALIFVEGTHNAVTISELRVGDKVRMILNSSSVAILIIAEAGPQNKVYGTVAALGLATTPKTMVVTVGTSNNAYTLVNECKAYHNNAEVALTTILVGDKVELTINGMSVTRIKITEKAGTVQPPVTGTDITGTIQAIASSSGGTMLTVQSAAGVQYTYQLGPNCQIRVRNTYVTTAQLRTGLPVKISVVESLIVAVEVLPVDVEGSVTAISLVTAPRTITISRNGAIPVTHALSADAKAYFNNAEVALSTVVVGDKIQAAKYVDEIVTITITERHVQSTTITGTIQSITASSLGTLVAVRTSNGVNYAYLLDAAAQVKTGSIFVPASHLATGLTVTVTVVNSKITLVDVHAQQITGTVSAINLASAPSTIAVTSLDATPVTTVYTLSSDCKAYLNSTEVALSTIAVGDKVQLTRYFTEVTSVTVTEKAAQVTTITGSIQNILDGSLGTSLTVATANGMSFSYPLSATVQVKVRDSFVAVTQLVVGLPVAVTVVNSQITLVEVLAQQSEGTVSAISLTTSPRTISVTSLDTTPVTTVHNLSFDCKAYHDNAEVALSTIVIGDKVRTAKHLNEVTSVTVIEKHYPSTLITGTLTAVSVTANGTTLTVRTTGGTDYAYQLAPNAKLKHGTTDITLAQLTINSQVTITVVNNQISLVQVH